MEIILNAQIREILGKKVRGLRREGWVPGNLYGRGVESTAVKMLYGDIDDVYKEAGTSQMIRVQLEGKEKTLPAFIREVQRDVISQDLLHVDLELVDLLRAVSAQIPIHLIGQAPVVEDNRGVLTQSAETVELEGLPAELPHFIEVDVSVLTSVEHSIYASDLEIPEGIEILTGPETVIVYITPLREEEEEKKVPLEEEFGVDVDVIVEEQAPEEEGEQAW
ncbi:MAG: 50S ribosomal protein L25 [Chloroflexia bacterium]|nr:50S ribosomal protein L25 [Chloroflexia bacterium]